MLHGVSFYLGQHALLFDIMEGVGQSNVVTMATTLTSISKKNQECLNTVGLMRGSTTIHCSVSSSWNTYHQRVGGGEDKGHVVWHT